MYPGSVPRHRAGGGSAADDSCVMVTSRLTYAQSASVPHPPTHSHFGITVEQARCLWPYLCIYHPAYGLTLASDLMASGFAFATAQVYVEGGGGGGAGCDSPADSTLTALEFRF